MQFLVNRSNWRLAREFALRDIQGLYSRSQLGLAWIAITPLGVLAIYWIVFSYVLGVSWTAPGHTESLGYALPFFCGLVPYLAVADVLSSATRQFENKRTLVVRAAFPLIVVPAASWLKSMIVAAPGLVFLLIVAAIQSRHLTWASLLFVGGLLCMVLLTAGLALLLATVGAFFGDLQHSLQLVTRLIFYTAPISYPLDAAPAKVQALLLLNPLTSITEWVRTPLLFGVAPSAEVVAIASAWSVGTFLLGSLVFVRVHRSIPDVL
jgi:lipopolysaccharide transport system permease protein